MTYLTNLASTWRLPLRFTQISLESPAHVSMDKTLEKITFFSLYRLSQSVPKHCNDNYTSIKVFLSIFKVPNVTDDLMACKTHFCGVPHETKDSFGLSDCPNLRQMAKKTFVHLTSVFNYYPIQIYYDLVHFISEVSHQFLQCPGGPWHP